MTPEKFPRADFVQIDNVRGLFHTCIANHNCGKIRAHWIDNLTFSIDSTYKTSNTFTPFTPVSPSRLRNHTARLSSKHKLTTPRFISPYSYHASVYSYKKSEIPRVRRALEAMPDWLITFYHDYDNHKYDDNYFGMDTSFRFQKGNDEDLLKLLDKNTIVVKEIERAAEFQAEFQEYKQETPVFNLKFARDMLKALIPSWAITWSITAYQDKIFYTARAVMDIYTVARIIKSHMKNVIIYEGTFHADNVVYILTKLGYTTNKIERRDVGLALKKPIPVPVPPVPIEDDFLKDSDPELLTDV